MRKSRRSLQGVVAASLVLSLIFNGSMAVAIAAESPAPAEPTPLSQVDGQDGQEGSAAPEALDVGAGAASGGDGAPMAGPVDDGANPTGDPADALGGNSAGDPDIPSGPPSASADEPSTPAAETSDALMVGEGSPADEQVPTEVPDPAADDGAPALDVAPLAAAVEEVVPDISVVPTPEDVTFYWPDFGVAADQGVYGVQFQQPDSTWLTMRTDTQPLTDNIPEDVQNADRWVTVFDVQPDETYTARIVSAPTEQDIFDTTEDADPAEPPSDVTVSQPLPFTIERFAQSAGNPPLAAKCGLDFALVLDSSGSIGPAISSLKTAANSFVDALVDTGSEVSQVSFATRSPGSGGTNVGPIALTSANLATIKNSYAGLRTDDRNNNRTNWQDGLLKSQDRFIFPPPGPGGTPGAPDLVIVITDGNPNTIGSGQSVREGSPAAVNPAIGIANQMKRAGAHMFVIAVGQHVSEAPIKAISGTERLNSDGSNFATAGFTTTRDYASLAQTLKQIAVDLCAPSLTITKLAQRPGSTDYVPADGWTFETTVRLNGGSGAWVNPGTDAIPADTPSTKSQVTSNSGAANFQWKPSGDITSDVRIREITQAGFTRQPALVCNARNALTGATRPITVQADGNGVWDLSSVPGGVLGSREIVTCTAQNNLDFAKLTVVKDAAGSPQDFGFTGAITQAIATPDARFPNTFTLDDDTSSATPKQVAWERLSPGTYVITEDALPAGWRLDDIELTGTGGQLTKDLVARTATIVLDGGGDATVTFRNRSSSTLTVTKAFTKPAGLTLPGGFTFTIPVRCTGQPDRDVIFTKAEIDAGQLSETLPDIPVGTVCSFDETLPLTPIDGWTWGSPTFTPASKSMTITANATQNVATVTNTISRDVGYLEILKEFEPGASGFTGTFPAQLSCSDGQNGTITLVPGTPLVIGPLATGTQCTVSEPDLPTPPAGWSFGTPSITGSPVTVVKSTAANPGGRVTVTNTIRLLQAGLTLEKVADKTSVAAVGEVITYTLTARNTGEVTLTGVGITDPLPGLSALSCTPAQPITLAPGGALTCTATYQVTQADLNAGGVTNTATATGTPPTGTPLTPTDNVTVPGTRTPALTLEKIADKASVSTVGETIGYTFTARNTGNVTLSAVSISDPLPGLSTLSCAPAQPTTLAPGGVLACTATYQVTQADLNAGAVTNTATATGTPPTGTPLTPTDTVTVPGTQTPGLALKKVADKTAVAAVGETIGYTFTATNTGNVTLTAVSISDPLTDLSPLSCTPAQPITLAPGGALTCTATYQVTQADLNAGGVTNTATATGTPPTGTPLTPTDTVTVPGTQTPGLALKKVADKTSVSTVGETITYTLTARNTGNVTLTDVEITDPLPGLSALSCTPAQPTTLAPGGLLSCTAMYVVTQADLNNGGVTNTATATGTPPGGTPFTRTQKVRVPGTQTPDLTLVKAADKTSVSTVGETIGYTFTATNTGNVTLTDVAITDPLAGLSALTCAPAQPTTLAPGATLSCSATYQVTQADLNAGGVTNTATATGTPPFGPSLTPTATVTVPGDQAPGLALKKFANKTSVSTVGETITYTLTARNTGNVALTAVSISDPLAGLSPLSCTPAQPTTLAPTEQLVCTATYQVTQADLDAGGMTNTATATGTPPTGPPLTRPVKVRVPVAQTPALTLEKVANKASVATVGETIAYTLTARNAGNVTLTDVAITDPLPGLSALSCESPVGTDVTQPITLAPGGVLVCTGTYEVTQVDLDAGGATNTATATGTPPIGPSLTPTATVTVPGSQTPALALVKAADKASVSTVGETIRYTFTATNAGNVTLTAVGITDPLTGLSALACTPAQPTTLAPGASLVCTATYQVTQADLNAGAVANTATATGRPPTGPPLRSTDTVLVPVAQRPGLTLDKVADKTSVAAMGETIAYTFTATNTGNLTLTDVEITDPLPGLSALSCESPVGTDVTQPITLAPGGVLVCRATYQVTQADLNAGLVANTATATGTPPTGPRLTPTDTVLVPVAQTPALTLVKVADKASVSTVGETIRYTFTATNAGNVTLTAVGITDPLTGLSALACTPGQPTTLAPGASLVCTATYQVTQADLNAGAVPNTATATGRPPTGPPLRSTDTVLVPVAQRPGLTLDKVADKTSVAAVGETIAYTFTATNTGNLTLTDVEITDPLPGLSALSCESPVGTDVTQPITLAPTESLVCTATYQVTQADLNAGIVGNTATATGTPPTGPRLTPTDTVLVPGTQSPGLTLDKAADRTGVSTVGETIRYTFTARNTGNVTLTEVSITDPLPGLSALACTPGQSTTLAPGATLVCTATYEVTQADLNAGAVANTATATGTPPTGPPLRSTDTVTVPGTQRPGLTLDKVADKTSVAAVGESISYTLTARNTGNVTLTEVSISDPLPGLSVLSCTPAQPTTLAAGASLVCTATYQVTQANLDAGTVGNTATATGTPPTGPRLTSTDTVRVPGTQTPGKVDKVVDKTTGGQPTPLSPLAGTGAGDARSLVAIGLLAVVVGGLMIASTRRLRRRT